VSPELWALVSAGCFAGSHVVSKRGLQDTSVTAGSLLVLGVSWVVVAVWVAFDPPGSVSTPDLLVFAALGLLTPAVARWASLMGVDVLGPTISVPIQQGLRPVLAVTAAVVVLDESVGLVQAIGIGAIIAGGWVLSRAPTLAPATAGSWGSGRAALALRVGLRRGTVFPVLAAVALTTSDLVIRATVGDSGEPAFAAMLSTGTGFLAWLLVVAGSSRVRRLVRFGPGSWWLAMAGALVGVAIVALFTALVDGNVAVVTPIASSQPLIVFVLSALLLRDLEQIRRSTVLAGLAIVAGTILVAA
jgi:drug/metabolite transporter (DMT)-like permease